VTFTLHEAPAASGVLVEHVVPAACVKPVPITLMLVRLSDLPDWFVNVSVSVLRVPCVIVPNASVDGEKDSFGNRTTSDLNVLETFPTASVPTSVQ
jgi:hypothetical protein